MPVVDTAATAPVREVVRVDSDSVRTVGIEKIAREIENGRSAALERHLQAMLAGGGPPLIADNQVRLLIDGPATYDAMFAAMGVAKRSIDIEVYILRNDRMGFNLRELLLKKLKEGVRVRVIYDGLGSLSTPKEFFEPLIAAGAQVLEFNPVGDKPLALNHRDHRKITVVDGETGYVGGINISDVYSSGSASNLRSGTQEAGQNEPRNDEQAPRDRGWRDTQIEIRGPAVIELQRIFLETWYRHRDSIDSGEVAALRERAPRPLSSAKDAGDRVVRIIASSADDSDNVIYTDLLAAIRQSRTSIHLTMAYFSPDRQTIDALKAAAERGVDVKLILPGFSDVSLIFEAGRAHYFTLMKSGVKIYERQHALLHAKSAVIDGVWSTVGSSNMDMRSFLHNNEINAVVLGSAFGDEMEAMFQQDLRHSRLITLESWRKRPWTLRLKQWFFSLWGYWL